MTHEAPRAIGASRGSENRQQHRHSGGQNSSAEAAQKRAGQRKRWRNAREDSGDAGDAARGGIDRGTGGREGREIKDMSAHGTMENQNTELV